MTEFDPHGQPVILAWNAARRRERDISELLGLAKGVLCDGIVNDAEIAAVHQWIQKHPDALEHWPVNVLASRLDRMLADHIIDEDERTDLHMLLNDLTGGRVTLLTPEEAATELPLDRPAPPIEWQTTYVFTGKFAWGTRAACEREVLKRGGWCEANVTQLTRYLVIGTFGSRDWVQSNYGRKIQKAVEYRTNGVPIRIVSEDHWAQAL